MKLNERQILTGALKNLETLFSEMPDFAGFEVKPERSAGVPGRAPAAEVAVRFGRRTLKLWVAATAYGQPAKLKEKAGELEVMLKRDASAKGLLCAPFVSQDSARVCAEAGLGYVDLCGNCRLVFEGIYVAREGKPNQYPEKRETKALAGLFSLKASRVLKVLLRRLERPWKLKDAADKAKVSLALAFKVARMLEERELARGRRGKFILEKPEDLLKLWADHYSPREYGRIQCYSMDSIREVEACAAVAGESQETPAQNLKGQVMFEQTRSAVVMGMMGYTFALGGYSAAEYLAPRVNYGVATIYVKEDPSRYAAHMGLKAVDKGGNVELIAPLDPWFFEDCRVAHGRRVTSPAQTYLDVTREPVRGVEAGEALLKEFRKLTPQLWPEEQDA